MRALTLVAVTHHQAPFPVLERVTLDADGAHAVAFALGALPGVDEAAVLSTCNRTELYLIGATDAARGAIDVLAAHTDMQASDLARTALVLRDDEASLHLFRVAAGLESRVVGESEILGQVRAAAARATRTGASGPTLDALFRWAAATGRRARRDSGGPARPSLARTALDAAPTGAVLVLGAGAMAGAVTAELRARRVPYRVVARRADRGLRLARRPDDVADFASLEQEIAAADVVVCATGARNAVIHAATVAAAMIDRHHRPLTVVDLSMPRNVAADVATLAGVELIRLQDLHGGHGDLQLRRANDAVVAEHRRYRLWLGGRAAGPVIAAMRRRVTDICLAEAERQLGPNADAFARRLAGRILHEPTIAIKELSASGDIGAIDALAMALGIELAASVQILRAAS